MNTPSNKPVIGLGGKHGAGVTGSRDHGVAGSVEKTGSLENTGSHTFHIILTKKKKDFAEFKQL